MLTFHFSNTTKSHLWHPGVIIDTNNTPVWLDLLSPTDEERSQAELILGGKLPVREQISAIELSSRLKSANDTLRLNIPAFVPAESSQGALTPLGFVLTPTVLVSVRYGESLAFKHLAESIDSDLSNNSSVDIFIELIEAIVNVAADSMEAVGGELSTLSSTIFSNRNHQGALLKKALFKVGLMQRQIVQLRSATLGVSRVITYLCEIAPPWLGSERHIHLKTVQADIGSLNEFDQQLSDRLQFLLDAVLGFINNDQNDVMKVLTIVSVVTIPPMVLAGIWGMNFKSIPEYDWPHGYMMALIVMAISVIAPLLIFKWKKWF
ncbi:CorA family divalent cation transporter [Pedobacter nutrimenti]|uniref:CorA family divalent cation transporter n=1 Tax=Pedobacter nutrimenti TaxID=1241337 RepID=UPI00292EFC43|nr:CorA family divalent cation transporter [Pedobacter nutrimenti]